MKSLRTLPVMLACISALIAVNASAQSELPVLVKPPANAKVMMLIDDSGSMNALVEHASFSPTSACATDSTKNLPSVIFRVETAGGTPVASTNVRPILIEMNAGFYSSSATGSLYAPKPWGTPTAHSLIQYMTCNDSNGNQQCCSGTSGGSCPKIGINTGQVYGGSSTGTAMFAAANLLAQRDSSGHQYLLMKYRTNTYENGFDNWKDVWATFNSSGVQQDNFTTTWVTAGGTVVFNGIEVFLSQGWYRKEYLRWIFYCATPAERASLPGRTRLEAVRDVTTDLINTNTNVAFGIATLNGSTKSAGTHSGSLLDQFYTPEGDANSCNTGQIRKPIGTANATLISELATLTPRGGTPLTATYTEALRYFGGATDSDPCTASTSAYTSPIANQCDAHSIVMLTDGLPTGESARRLPNGSFITNLDGVANAAANNSACSDSNCRAGFLSDASYYGFHNDLRGSIAGVQNVVSYAVAFGLTNYALLNRFAEAGGSGTAYTASTSDDLSSVLNDIVSTIFNTPTSGAGVATLEKLFGETRVYQPIFFADNWISRIQVFRFNDTTRALDYEFDMADVLDQRNLTSSPRNIIAGLDTDNDGRTNSTIAFNVANAATLRPRLFQFYDSATLSSTLLPTPLQAYTTNTAAVNLISYILGTDATGMRVRDRNADGLADRLGDVVYSKPVEVGPKNGNVATLDGYNDFVAGRQSQPRILLVGANDGMLHAFDSTSGAELWAYIPSSQVPYLERLARTSYNTLYRRSFVDGPIAVEDVYINGAWRTIAMFGLRTGGSTFTVLDITNRASPSLIWEVSDPAVYGQSWSKPTVVITNGGASTTAPASFNWYMVVGTGEGKATTGANLGVYNLNSTTPPTVTTVSISSADPIGSRTSGVATSQNDRDRNVDRLYVGTEQGDLFRVHVTAVPSGWTVQKVYDGSATNPIVATPLTVLADNPVYVASGSGAAAHQLAVGVYFGTGRHDVSTDITAIAANTQSIIGILDPVNTTDDAYAGALTNLTKTNLANQSVSAFSVRRDAASGKYFTPAGKNGFYVDLDTSITVASNFINPVGEVVNSPINVRGQLLFSTFLPDNGTCDIGGYGFLQGVHFQTGGGSVVDYYKDSSHPFFNGGIPDINGDTLYNATDLSTGLTSNKLEVVLDSRVESVDLADATTPYRHDSTLRSNDIRLHPTNGGVYPAVSSIGHTGLPSAPAVLIGRQMVLVQDAYPSDPDSIPPGAGDGGEDSPGDVGGSDQMPPPNLLPINIYNLPVDVLSFHEVTK